MTAVLETPAPVQPAEPAARPAYRWRWLAYSAVLTATVMDLLDSTVMGIAAPAIRGDLGAIDAGDATTKTAAVKSLTVQSFGTLGTTTGAPNLSSDLVGALGKLVVKGSMKDAKLDVSGGADGKVGPVTIGGSLIGGAGARSGTIHSTGSMGTVKIGVANDRVELLLQTADGDDVELDLSSHDASRFALDML